jgi:uncharacterized protein YyaL (SSP411 family)
MPGFRRVLEAVSDAWAHRRDEIERQAGALATTIAAALPPGARMPTPDTLVAAHDALWAHFDRRYGGFGGAPKFPQAPTLEFLMRAAGRKWAPRAEQMLVETLEAMDRGGIRDHLGGGFARYSTDDRWLVPHFEKMLYDNALLARLYARAWQVTGIDRFADVARSTLDYLLDELDLPGGGLASGEDADSEGEEGRFTCSRPAKSTAGDDRADRPWAGA